MADDSAYATDNERSGFPTLGRPGSQNVEVRNVSLQGNSVGLLGQNNIANVENLNLPPEPRSTTHELCLESLAFPYYHKREGILETPGTCKWLLQHDEYRGWIEKGGVLYIRGRPGTGKSTLMQHALQKAQHDDSPQAILIGSFFFHRRGHELQYTRLGLFRSLLHQILRKDVALPLLDKFCKETNFDEGCKKEGKNWRWIETDLTTFLEHNIQTLLQCCPVRLYVDALDEAGDGVAKTILSDFKTLADKGKADKSRLSICFSCRPYPHIMSGHDYDFLIDIEECNGPDITTFVDEEFKKAPAFLTSEDPVLNHQDVALIKKELVTRASGVFQWVSLVTLDILKLHGEKKETIINRIKQIPEELGHLYEDMIRNIGKADQKLALQMFRWISFARRPLSPAELHHAIFSEAPLQECMMSQYEMEQRIMRLSRGLAKVLESFFSKKVQFDHESVKEYMVTRGIRFMENRCHQGNPTGSVLRRANFIMSRSCIRYLKVNRLSTPPNILGGIDTTFPFYHYARHTWAAHAEIAEAKIAEAEIAEAEIAEAEKIFQGDLVDLTEWPSNWICHQYTIATWDESFHDLSLEHIACIHGLYSTLEELVNRLETWRPKQWGFCRLYVQYRQNQEIRRRLNMRDKEGRTPISLAAEFGHQRMIKQLLDTGKVDAGPKDRQGRSPLLYAAMKGYEEVARQLLNTSRIDPNGKDEDGKTPLLYAAKQGHDKVVRQLLSTGKVDLNSKGMGGRTPLSDAAYEGHSNVVRLLLSISKVDPDSKGADDLTPLSWAAKGGSDEVVRLLLSTNKVDVNSRDSEGDSPLTHAARGGHVGVVKQLLNVEGIDVDIEGCYGTPLWFAAYGGHVSIVKQLLDTGKVNVNYKGRQYTWIPLWLAALEGHDEVVKQLLNVEGIDVDIEGCDGTALFCATWDGHESIVKQLLSTGKANVNFKDGAKKRTPLWWAATEGHDKVVKQLLDTGKVDIDSEDCDGETALSQAIKKGHEKVIELLQDYERQVRR